MNYLNQLLARRAVIKGTGLGLVAGGLASTLPAQSASAAEGGEIWSSEYWTKKGDIPLWMFRKRVGAPKAGEPSRPVLFLVHGSSVTSRTFDINVPGPVEYSVMNEFARYGFDVWTMDHENYGKSGRTSGNSDVASGVEDMKVAMDVVARETGRQKYHFLGESSGARADDRAPVLLQPAALSRVHHVPHRPCSALRTGQVRPTRPRRPPTTASRVRARQKNFRHMSNTSQSADCEILTATSHLAPHQR